MRAYAYPLGFLDPAQLASKLEMPALVDPAVFECGGCLLVTRHHHPSKKPDICRPDQALPFVDVGYDLEKQPGAAGTHRPTAPPPT